MHVTVEQDFDDLDYHNNGQRNVAKNFVEVELTCTNDSKKSLGRIKVALHDANLDSLLSNIGYLYGKGKDSGEQIGERVTANSAPSSNRRSGGGARRSGGGSKASASRTNDRNKAFNKAVREWAQGRQEWAGEVSESGRLANNVIESYKTHHPDWKATWFPEEVGGEEAEATQQAELTEPEPTPRSDVEPEPRAASAWTGEPQSFTGVG